jgi:LCP family protein required for cell wall assembly
MDNKDQEFLGNTENQEVILNQDDAEKEKPKPSGVKRFFYIIFSILALALIGSGIWLSSIWSQIYQVVMPGSDEIFVSQNPPEEDAATLPNVMNILLLGLDSRDQSIRSDTIMIITLNRQSSEINLCSVPRDMRVPITGYREDKINHAYAFGGVALSRETVENFLDIKVDYYIETDFDGFENVINLLGGVELDIEKRMYYRGIDVMIDLQPGVQRLNGDKALQYVRWRSDGEGDLGRVRRQQQLLEALLQEIITFKNFLRIPRLLPEIADNVRTDLELSQAISLANRLKNVEFDHINTFTLPGRPAMINEVSYLIPEEDEIRILVDEYMRESRSSLN